MSACSTLPSRGPRKDDGDLLVWWEWAELYGYKFCCPLPFGHKKGPKAVMTRFYLLIRDTDSDSQREYTLSDPCQTEIQRQGSKLFLLYSCLCFFLSLLMQLPFFLHLKLFLRTDTKKGFSALVCLAPSYVVKGYLWQIFTLLFVNTQHSRANELKHYPEALMMFLFAFSETKLYQETHNLYQLAASRPVTNACGLCSMD